MRIAKQDPQWPWVTEKNTLFDRMIEEDTKEFHTDAWTPPYEEWEAVKGFEGPVFYRTQIFVVVHCAGSQLSREGGPGTLQVWRIPR